MLMRYERLNEREEVPTNKHPIITGISSAIFLLGTLAFLALACAAATGCSSPPDQCGEVSQCGGDDVDGSTPDQPDGNTTSTDGGQTQPDGNNNTNVCATNAWMEAPPMFDCFQFNSSGQEVWTNECDPLLISNGSVCQVRCVGIFTGPNPEDSSYLVLNPDEHYFEYINVNSESRYRCRQRL